MWSRNKCGIWRKRSICSKLTGLGSRRYNRSFQCRGTLWSLRICYGSQVKSLPRGQSRFAYLVRRLVWLIKPSFRNHSLKSFQMAWGNEWCWERSMRYAFRGTALLFLLLGNTPPDQKPTDIIVTAPTRVAKELKKQTLNFIRTVPNTAEQIQFSRRDDPFCVRIAGLDIAYHDVIRKKFGKQQN